jgi:hypothetical protein
MLLDGDDARRHHGPDVVAHCPGECGCRLSVVAGEPRVGEKYAVLERDAKRFRVAASMVGAPILMRCGAIDRWYFETYSTDMRYATLGEYADALLGGNPDGQDE